MNKTFSFLLSLIRLLTAAIFITGAHDAYPQGFFLRGEIRDAFTNSGIENAQVTLMDADSTVIATVAARYPRLERELEDGSILITKDITQGAGFQFEVPEEGTYILAASMGGYEPETKKIEIIRPGRNKPVVLDGIYLIPKSKELDELTVTGTKLKVYHRGDTLVYDAAAFVMDSHNVLEDLVRRLPGVEFRDGQVFVNGRFVDNITIGGKDFMKSDPKQLMAMLPAYVVDKLKFYDKAGEQSTTMGRDMEDSSYVMDVTMKRDYHGAWLGNMDAGAGTEKRWGGVGFAMYCDDRQAFSLSLDGNNLGLARMATDLCTDIEDSSSLEDSRNLQANLGYAYHPTDRLRIDSHARIRSLDKEEGSEEMFTSAAAGTDRITRRTSKNGDLLNWSISGDAALTWRPRKGLYGRLAYAVEHGRRKGDEASEAMTGNGDSETPDSLMADLLLPALPTDLNLENISNVYRDISSSRQTTWMHKVSAESHVAVADNLLRVSASFKSDDGRQTRHRDFLSRIFSETMEEELAFNLFKTRTALYSVDAGLDYDINYADNSRLRGILTPFYRFSWDTQDNDRLMFGSPTPGDSPDWTLNPSGSRGIGGSTLTHKAGVSMKHEFQTGESGRWMMLSARMAAQLMHRVARCSSDDVDSSSGRDFLLLSPEISIRWNPKPGDRNGSKSSMELKCRMDQKAPSVNDLADYTDASDPMNVLTGNPDLNKQTELEASFNLRHGFEKSRSSLHASVGHTIIWSPIAMKSFYDLETGIRTIMPVNAGGARETSVDLSYSLPISRGQAWWLDIGARGSLSRCDNLTVSSGTDAGSDHMDFGNYLTRLSVRRHSGKISGSYAATYQGNVLTASSAPGTHLRSLMQNLVLELKLPAGFQISANCNMISRFGYVLPSLDRTVFLLNASIRKSVLNDMLNFSLSAVDILRQRQNAFSVVDGSGITESMRTRFIPPYFMVSVYYRWSHTPKKK